MGINFVEYWDKIFCYLKLILKKRIVWFIWWIYFSLEYKCYCLVINYSGIEYGLNFEFKFELSLLFFFINGIEFCLGYFIRLLVGLFFFG